jgi:nucleoside-diphosphate-sugar epimerase
VRILVTGGTGVLGRVLIPLLNDAGHEVLAPGHADLDLFDAEAVRRAVEGVDAVYHLATRIPTGEARNQPGAWDENDRLRAVATPLLVDAANATSTATFILASVTFVYPAEGPADEVTPVTAQANLGSMMAAEAACQRFAAAGRTGVILRLGLLWGPGTGSDAPQDRYGATLEIHDAGRALAACLAIPSGVYNVVADGERVSNAKFKAASGWTPASSSLSATG